jgi:2-keto-3-deoxy-L-rhamnonate aldolase RhmA
MAGNAQHVILHDGKWAVKEEGRARKVSVFETKREAIDAAREIARLQGSNVVIHGKAGQIFSWKSEIPSRLNEDEVRAAVRAVIDLTQAPKRAQTSRGPAKKVRIQKSK